MTFYVSTPSGGGADGPPPSNPPFHILPSSIHDAEALIELPLRDAVEGLGGYEDLKAYVERVKGWVFYRPEGETNHSAPSQDALDAERYLDLAMSATADNLMTVGMLLNRINEAGQIYVQADQQSTFPSQ